MKKIIINKKFKNDLLLAASVLTVAIIILFIIRFNGGSGEYVEVKQNGELIASYSLSQNQTVMLENNGGYNNLIINNGEVYIDSASCPDKLCVHKGKISKNGETLVCLPNKTVITVKSKNQKETDF